MRVTQRIAPCLWFDHQAEEAATFYVSVFKNSKITSVARYSKAGQETHRRPAGSVMTVAFELDGQAFTALNGGPAFTFNEAVSLQVNCETQEEVDYYWEKLSKGGDSRAQQCGWPRIPEGATGHGSDASHEEDRDRRTRARVRRIASLKRVGEAI